MFVEPQYEHQPRLDRAADFARSASDHEAARNEVAVCGE